MYSIITSLMKIAEGFGATFHYNAPVKRVDTADGRATDVTLENGEQLRADVVIVNADLPYAYQELLPGDPDAPRMDKLKYTSSTLMFYWGVKGERTDKLLHHNVFLSDHVYEKSFAEIFHEQLLLTEPSSYIHAPVRTVPEFAPPDADALMVLVPTGHLDAARRQDFPELQARAKDWVFQRLARIGWHDLKERIVLEETLPPHLEPGQGRDLWPESQRHAGGVSAPAQPPQAV
mgnify:CR=1 FL=1